MLLPLPERTNRAGSAADHFTSNQSHVAISIMHGLTLQFIPPSTHAIACSTRTNHFGVYILLKAVLDY